MYGLHIRRRTKQQSQLNETDSQPPSSYWDNLSKIWLTKGALKELDRRNNNLNEYSLLYQRDRRSLTRNLLTEWDKDQWTVSEILRTYSADDVKKLKQFSRLGGIDISNLREVFIIRYSYFTQILIRPSIQSLLILSNTPGCYR